MTFDLIGRAATGFFAIKVVVLLILWLRGDRS